MTSTDFGRLGMRHAALRALAVVAVGILLSRFSSLPWWCVALVVAAALVGARFTRGWSLYAALLLAAFGYTGMRSPEKPADYTYGQGWFEAMVEDEPTRPGVSRYVLGLRPPLQGRVTLWMRSEDVDLRYGDIVVVSARIGPLDFPRNPGLVDFNETMRRRGFVGSFSAKAGQVEILCRGRGMPWMRWVVMPMRRYVAQVIDRHMQGDEGTLLAGLLLGGSQGLPRDVRQAFTDAGVVHILAVSGMNVTIVVGVLWLVLSVLGIRGWWRFGVGAAGVLLYLSLVGWSAAPARAAWMACVVLLSYPIQRRVSATAGLAVAALVLLIADPLTLFDAGAQLSFAATAGIVLVLERLKEPLSRLKGRRRMRSWVIGTLAASFAATVATAPLMLHHFFRCQPLSFLTTFAVAPLVGLAMPLGLVVIFSNLASSGLAGVFANALWAIIWLLLRVTLFMGRLDWAIVQPGRLPWLWVGWAYLLMLLGLNWRVHRARTGLLLVLAAGLNLAVWPAAFHKAETRVTFLDPGQGDAVLLEDTLGHRILYDAGIDGPGVVRDYLRSRGIRRLDVVVLTHPDRDHYGGLLDLDERFRIDRLLVPVTDSPDTVYPRLLSCLEDRGARVEVVGRGDELEGTGFGIRFVLPDPATRMHFVEENIPTNAVSLVARVEHAGFTMLLTGDMDYPDRLLAESAGVDLLKSPHHGSRKGNPPALYAALRPEHVVVMGRYPTPAKLEERFAGSSASYVNTREEGALTVVFRRGQPVFERYRRDERRGVNLRPSDARSEPPSSP